MDELLFQVIVRSLSRNRKILVSVLHTLEELGDSRWSTRNQSLGIYSTQASWQESREEWTRNADREASWMLPQLNLTPRNSCVLPQIAGATCWRLAALLWWSPCRICSPFANLSQQMERIKRKTGVGFNIQDSEEFVSAARCSPPHFLPRITFILQA